MKPSANDEIILRTLILFCLFLITSGCQPTADPARVDQINALTGDVNSGLKIYADDCQRCHGPKGNGGELGPSILDKKFQKKEVIEFVLKGPRKMPSFSSRDDQTLADVAAYVIGL